MCSIVCEIYSVVLIEFVNFCFLILITTKVHVVIMVISIGLFVKKDNINFTLGSVLNEIK